jgi:hypothetical protein
MTVSRWYTGDGHVVTSDRQLEMWEFQAICKRFTDYGHNAGKFNGVVFSITPVKVTDPRPPKGMVLPVPQPRWKQLLYRVRGRHTL